MKTELLSRHRLLVSVSSLALVGAVLFGLILIRNRALDRLEHNRKLINTSDNIDFVRETLSRLETEEISILQSTRNVRAITRFGDAYFAATDGGLVRLS